MFRLVKVLNGNNQCEVQRIPNGSSITVSPGNALICSGGNAAVPGATVAPEYISMANSINPKSNKIDAMLVTEDMVFKVELTGTIAPTIGMSVGLSTHKSQMDAVTFNTNGKGTVIDVDDDGKTVYVRFRK